MNISSLSKCKNKTKFILKNIFFKFNYLFVLKCPSRILVIIACLYFLKILCVPIFIFLTFVLSFVLFLR
ncbi:unnamed protein product [Meloidogyne enterolobii]|uniref:Uncharacterized protein n=1 Tax=Meloidogyne enterolobii TaxID=390850 RepID=A0ACB1ALY7_MELEN